MTTVKTPEVKLLSDGGVSINQITIAPELFSKEKVKYALVFREDLTDDIIKWMGECGDDAMTEKASMKQDLKELFSIDDIFVFSNIATNEYVAASEKPYRFYKICEDILITNGMSKMEAIEALR